MKYKGTSENPEKMDKGTLGKRTNPYKCWSHIAPFSRLYLVKFVVQLKLATVNKPIILLL